MKIFCSSHGLLPSYGADPWAQWPPAQSATSACTCPWSSDKTECSLVWLTFAPSSPGHRWRKCCRRAPGRLAPGRGPSSSKCRSRWTWCSVWRWLAALRWSRCSRRAAGSRWSPRVCAWAIECKQFDLLLF